ncbi:MAG TPA: hypothetical protein VF665_17990 [Longimicrobium sp.]|jgi:hypothetical protein|uniref:hypothetical protein n=1 Tax=Longimicrobium sp. TaxID=2029185 RepID=UPI002ED79039
MTKNKQPQPPAQPTRERALYVAAARVYANAFRATFVDPVRARRLFREAVEWNTQDGALKMLALYPDEFGPRMARRFASAVRDPAFIYWTQRERRPRLLLIKAAEALYAEDRRRAHIARREDAAKEVQTLAAALQDTHARRRRQRDAVREMVKGAEAVYAHPARACRVILRTVRRHGVRRTRALLEALPPFFGPLRLVPVPCLFGLLWMPTAHEARSSVAGFLASGFDPAAAARGGLQRPLRHNRTGSVARAIKREWDARAEHRRLVDTTPEPGGLDEAARLIAILCRRRDVDEPPAGKGPPPIHAQLAAMLPGHMAGLIVEALKASAKKSGEAPEWGRGEGLGLELARSLGQELKSARGLSRGRGAGLER